VDPRRTLVPLALIASIGLTACGSSDSSSGGSDLSRKDIAAKANAICKKAEGEANKITPPTNIQDASAAAAYFDKTAPIIDQETKDLAALKPDSDVKGDWDAFIGKQNAANDLFQKVRAKADAKDASGLEDLKKIEPLGDAVTSTAKKVGATSCT
jgi:hypothetical protein